MEICYVINSASPIEQAQMILKNSDRSKTVKLGGRELANQALDHSFWNDAFHNSNTCHLSPLTTFSLLFELGSGALALLGMTRSQ